MTRLLGIWSRPRAAFSSREIANGPPARAARREMMRELLARDAHGRPKCVAAHQTRVDRSGARDHRAQSMRARPSAVKVGRAMTVPPHERRLWHMCQRSERAK